MNYTSVVGHVVMVGSGQAVVIDPRHTILLYKLLSSRGRQTNNLPNTPRKSVSRRSKRRKSRESNIPKAAFIYLAL